MTQHSTGPWFRSSGATGARSYISNPSWEGLASVVISVDGVPDAQGEANARLIAAAPDLLEALQAIELARNTDKTSDWVRATRLSDAAIAKATGGTP